MVSGQLLATLAAGIGLTLLVLAALTYHQVARLVAPAPAPAARPSVVATATCRPGPASPCGPGGG